MPSAITHCLCGEIALNSAESNINKLINKNRPAFFSGCQGPDFLMYYHILPWQSQKGAKEIRKLSSKLHEKKVNDFFSNMLHKAVESNDENLIAYVAGFLCHHSLDSIAHPYIYYFTDSVKGISDYSHQRFESQIDFGILNCYKLTVNDYAIDQKVKKIKKGRDVIADSLKETINELYDVNVNQKQMITGLDNMATVLKLLKDPDGKRYKFIEKVENIFNKSGMGTSMIIPQTYDNKLDAMNYRRDKWYYPADETKSFNVDFQYLFNEAVDKTKNEFDLLGQIIELKQDISQLLKTIDNRSYATGLNKEAEMTCFAKDRKAEK